jgi:hypothetical protein
LSETVSLCFSLLFAKGATMVALSSRMTGDVFCDSQQAFHICCTVACVSTDPGSNKPVRSPTSAVTVARMKGFAGLARLLLSSKLVYSLNFLQNNVMDELNVCSMLHPICSRRWEQMPVCLRVTERHEVHKIVMIFHQKFPIFVRSKSSVNPGDHFKVAIWNVSTLNLKISAYSFHVTISSIKGN